MTQDEAKRLAMKLYHDEYLKQGNSPIDMNAGMGALPFYIWIEHEHPQILSFRCSGEPDQIVSTWF